MKDFLFRRVAPAFAVALLSACIIDHYKGGEAAAPQLAYAETYRDTVGVTVSHAPVLGGGPVLRFRIHPALPKGLAFDTATGVVSGTPGEAADLEEYRVIAQGPGGVDTAYFPLEVVDTSAATPQSGIALKLGLKASAGFTLSRLIVEYVSSDSTDAVLRDTIFAGSGGVGTNAFSASSSSDQNVSQIKRLKPLRDWWIYARVLDVHDSVIYQDHMVLKALEVGETRPMTLIFEPRYYTYVVKFRLPDSLRASGTSQTQVLNARRVQLLLDDVPVADSTRVYFAPGAPGHALTIRYVRFDHTALKTRVYADIPGWPVATPVFRDSSELTIGWDTTQVSTATWTGPGSPSDPSYNASNPGGTLTPLTLTFGELGQVTVEPGLPPGPLFKKK